MKTLLLAPTHLIRFFMHVNQCPFLGFPPKRIKRIWKKLTKSKKEFSSCLLHLNSSYNFLSTYFPFALSWNLYSEMVFGFISRAFLQTTTALLGGWITQKTLLSSTLKSSSPIIMTGMLFCVRVHCLMLQTVPFIWFLLARSL